MKNWLKIELKSRLEFEPSFFRVWVWIFVIFGFILGANMAPKWVQKSIKKLMDFWIAPGRALERQK